MEHTITRDEVEDFVKDFFANNLNLDVDAIDENTQFIWDMVDLQKVPDKGDIHILDDLDLVEFAETMESEYDIELEDDSEIEACAGTGSEATGVLSDWVTLVHDKVVAHG
ncbi:hypothetical protein GR11A_00145 [Vibrio phage vB_VcorM_GR11A]|nr:hypothetical protein GR11A_00145 [Vibrio phage vB_VcorM_GR11A]